MDNQLNLRHVLAFRKKELKKTKTNLHDTIQATVDRGSAEERSMVEKIIGGL